MVKAIDPIGPYASAQALAALGLQVLPARHANENKAPTVKWKPYQDTRVTQNNIRQWFFGREPKNYWVLCGKLSGVVVLDTDSAEGEAWWRAVPGMSDLMDRTARVKTAKGHHYWFKIPDGWTKVVQCWAIHPETHATDDISFDFRGEGGGVLAPPSVHETGHVYAWEVPFTEILDAPVGLLDGTHRREAPPPRTKTGEAAPASVTTTGSGQVRSLLVGLLSSPPAEGGRNDWMARVAGHYAAQYRNQEDLFWLHCQQANASMSPPLSASEFDKTCRSLWNKERGKADSEVGGLFEFSADGGWLRGTGRKIMTQTRVVEKDVDGEIHTEYPPDDWADFDVKCLGVILGGEGESSDYWVVLLRSTTNDTLETVLPGAILGDTGKLSTWLANKRCTIMPPDNMYPRSGTYGVRLQRYLESQNPPKTHVTAQLGWNATIRDGHGGFVTLDEIITPTERLSFTDAGIRPDPRMKQQAAASHHYGFRNSKKEARRVLREVLTYQEETVTSVFGAWWAACLLKPQLQGSGMFPFMAIEAPSESGKTTGFFNMMVQMNGSTKGQSIQTGPATRNAIAAHHNGIVWIDDMDDPARIMELLRTATANGTIAKQGGADFGATMEFRLVAPVLLSGEALGISMQKATADRAIQIEVKSPTKRRSLRDPSKPQWDDIQELQAQYPEQDGRSGLSALAGWYVQLALAQAGPAQAALRAASQGDGRSSQKHAVLLAGARLLDALVASSPQGVALAWEESGGEHFKRVFAWVNGEKAAYNPLDNALTQELLPWALRHYSFPKTPEWRPGGDSDPVWVEGDEIDRTALLSAGDGVTIWFHPGDLATAWAKYNRGKTLERVHTEEALRKQADAVRTGVNKRKRQTGGSNKALYYYQISGALAAAVLARSTGGAARG